MANRFRVRAMPLDALSPYERNPRRITATAIEKVAAAIVEFGWRQPIVVDEDHEILVGHTRWHAAQTIRDERREIPGWPNAATAPVHVADGLSEAQKRAYRLADNRTGEETSWDVGLLRVELQDLQIADFDALLTGFTEQEIASLGGTGSHGLTDADASPAIPDDPVTIAGDVWVLGNHRILCGDSTCPDDVAACLDGIKPHLMVTDPPYGVQYDPGWRNRRDWRDGKSHAGRAVGTVHNDERSDWREAWALFPGHVAYVWHAGGFAHSVADSLIAAKFEIRAQIVWAKNNIVIGRGHYHYKHEPCWYAVRKGKTGHWSGGRKQATLWNIDKPLKSETGHSTQKPVECMKRPIENNSKVGQAVYDPFLGSGTTLIAAEMSGRYCHGVEIAPAYCDVIVKRWQDFTGREATLESTGKTFNKVKNARKKTKANAPKGRGGESREA